MNLPRRTLYLILLLFGVTVVLLFLAFNPFSKSKPQNVATVTPTASSPTTEPEATTILSLSPNPLVISAAGSQTLNVMIDTGSNTVTGVQLEMTYDPAVFSSVTLTPGTFFKSASPLINTVDKTTGRITYALTASPGAQGETGKGIVAQIQVVPTGVKKTTKIDLLSSSLATAQGISSSVLKSATGADISFAAAPTAQNITPSY